MDEISSGFVVQSACEFRVGNNAFRVARPNRLEICQNENFRARGWFLYTGDLWRRSLSSSYRTISGGRRRSGYHQKSVGKWSHFYPERNPLSVSWRPHTRVGKKKRYSLPAHL